MGKIQEYIWIRRYRLTFDFVCDKMEELLRRLLNDLSRIGEEHAEIFDSECREQMSRAVYEAFLKGTPNADIGNAFGLHSEQGNQAVRKALANYIVEASAKAIELGII